LVKSEEGRDGGDIDYAPVTALDHVAAKDLAGVERAIQVGGDDAIPVLLGDLRSGLPLRDSGAINKDIDVAELGGRIFETGFDAGGIYNMAGDVEGFGLEPLDFVGDDGNAVSAASGWDNVCSGFCQSHGEITANA